MPWTRKYGRSPGATCKSEASRATHSASRRFNSASAETWLIAIVFSATSAASAVQGVLTEERSKFFAPGESVDNLSNPHQQRPLTPFAVGVGFHRQPHRNRHDIALRQLLKQLMHVAVAAMETQPTQVGFLSRR